MLQAFVLETANAPGSSTTINLAGAPVGRRTFYSAFGSSATVFYALDDGTQQEWGIGTFTAGAPNTLARTTVLRNSSGTTSRLNFTGTTNAYCGLPPEYAVYRTSSGISQDTGVLNASAWCGASSGTASAYTLTPSPAITAYAAGQVFRFRAHAVNTYGATIAVSGLSAKTIKRIRNGAVSNLLYGDLQVGQVAEIVYDDSAATFLLTSWAGGFQDWQLIGQSYSASAVSTVDFTIPASFDELRLVIQSASPAANATPALRFSFDNGSSYLAGATDYAYSGGHITSTAMTHAGAAASEMQIGTATLYTGPALRGELTWQVFAKSGRADTHAMTTGGQHFRWLGTFYCGQAGNPTNVRFLFPGQNTSSHNIALFGRRIVA